MSHGQAAVERNFSLGKSSRRTNIEKSVIAKKTVRNHLQANKVNLPSHKIGYFGYPRKLVISCNSAYGRYKTFLEEKAKEDEKTVEKESCSRKS